MLVKTTGASLEDGEAGEERKGWQLAGILG